jgi:hypothetical protein
VDSSAYLEDVEKKKFLTLPGLETQTSLSSVKKKKKHISSNVVFLIRSIIFRVSILVYFLMTGFHLVWILSFLTFVSERHEIWTRINFAEETYLAPQQRETFLFVLTMIFWATSPCSPVAVATYRRADTSRPCPSPSEHASESMLRTYLVCRQKQANGKWEKHAVY